MTLNKEKEDTMNVKIQSIHFDATENYRISSRRKLQSLRRHSRILATQKCSLK